MPTTKSVLAITKSTGEITRATRAAIKQRTGVTVPVGIHGADVGLLLPGYDVNVVTYGSATPAQIKHVERLRDKFKAARAAKPVASS